MLETYMTNYKKNISFVSEERKIVHSIITTFLKNNSVRSIRNALENNSFETLHWDMVIHEELDKRGMQGALLNAFIDINRPRDTLIDEMAHTIAVKWHEEAPSLMPIVSLEDLQKINYANTLLAKLKDNFETEQEIEKYLSRRVGLRDVSFEF
ncbi:hypothetical protein AB4254_11695 [Vibrio breoganii]